MQNTKSNLVRLNEKYVVDLNRVTHIEKNESRFNGTKYHDITIFLDLPIQDKYDNSNQIKISSSKKKEINRILDLITQK
jgi:hypothetical protein